MAKEAKKLKKISGKKIAKKFVITIDGKKYSKTFDNKDDESKVIELIDIYNRTNSNVPEKKLIKMFTEKEEKEIAKKQEKKAQVKGVKKAIKKVEEVKAKGKSGKKSTKVLVDMVEAEYKDGNFSEEEIKRLEDLLAKKKAEAIASQPVTHTAPPTQRRSGEH